jgi:hypothetical protein
MIVSYTGALIDEKVIALALLHKMIAVASRFALPHQLLAI